MRIACLLFFLQIVGLTQPKAFAQEFPAAIKPLNIGDTVPDVVLENIINYSSSSARLSDFKGKLLILDFWATWCSGCIIHFPKMDSMQRMFGPELKVLLVSAKKTGDTPEKIDRFVGIWNKRYKNFPFPILAKDTVLANYFPFRILPHYVWLNEKMKIIAITTAAEITAETIASAIKEQTVTLRRKNDQIDFDKNQPLFFSRNETDLNTFRFGSYFSAYVPGVSTGTSSTINGKLYSKLTIRNVPLINLFKTAYRVSALPDSRIILEVENPGMLTPPPGQWDTWRYDNAWWYELITAPITRDQAYAKLREDLVQFFPYQVAFEEREVYVWKLYARDTSVISSSKPCIPAFPKSGELGISSAICCNASDLASQIQYLLSTDVADATGILGKVSYKLPTAVKDVKELEPILKKQGLYLRKTKQVMPVFVIRDKKQQFYP